MVESPTTTLRNEIKTILEENFPEYVVYPYFPQGGVNPPCIVSQQVVGSIKSVALGEVVSETEVGCDVDLTWQIDVYMKDPVVRDEVTDRVLKAIRRSRSNLKGKGIEAHNATRIQDMPDDNPGSNVYRKSMDFPFSIEMTEAI